MPLFELEEGPHRKFYRVERVGRRVELHWGRIGTAGQKKTLELATELEAEREYNREIERRHAHGYRKVFDESVPHSPEEAEAQELAKTGALTEYPRFVFKKQKQLVWIEVRNTVLAVAKGAVGETLVPEERACGSVVVATRERDALMASLVRKGYELETVSAPAPKKRTTTAKLCRHPELEAQLAADPHDDGTWMVLEDWLLAQHDPRSEIIEAEHAHDEGEAAQARGRILRSLLGRRAVAITHLMSNMRWRAGFVRACGFDARVANGPELLAELVASPAGRFLTELELRAPSFDIVAQLAPATLLETLSIGGLLRGAASSAFVDAAVFAPFTRLRSLSLEHLAGVHLHESLARLRTLALQYAAPLQLGDLLAQPFPRLEKLEIRLEWDALEYDGRPVIDHVPALRELVVIVQPHHAAAALERLIASSIVTRLARFELAAHTITRELTATERAQKYGGVFATVARVELPEELLV